MTEHVDTDRGRVGLVQDREHGHNVLVFGLRDELGHGADDVERSLGVRNAHDSVQKVDRSLFSRVVVSADDIQVSGQFTTTEALLERCSLLRTRHGVKVEIDSESILPRPSERLQEVRPCDATEERFALVRLDRPPSEGDADPVESGGRDLSEILLGLSRDRIAVSFSRGFLLLGKPREVTHDKRLVVLGHGVREVRAELFRKSPFVDRVVDSVDVVRVRVEGLKHARYDERFEYEPSGMQHNEHSGNRIRFRNHRGNSPSDVDSEDQVLLVVPLFVQGRNVTLRASRVVERNADPVSAWSRSKERKNSESARIYGDGEEATLYRKCCCR